MFSLRFVAPALAFAAAAIAPAASRAADAPLQVGVARIDITPELPIRLSGYQGGGRDRETTEIKRRLFARALAIGGDGQRPAVLITAEIIGVSAALSDAVAAALHASHGLERARVAVCATHTHTGPSIAGVLPFMFAQDVPADEAARIARYTDTLREKLIRVATAALAARAPGTLAWGEGRADFATQRRKIVAGKHVGFGVIPDGMVDRVLPVLRVADVAGRVRAVFTSYACHCTTLRGSDHFVHPDWAGEAAAKIEQTHPDAVALVAIGCGADANPHPRTGLDDAARHGAVIAAEIERLLGGELRPLGGVTQASFRRIELPLDHAVTRTELESRRTHAAAATRYAAEKFLQRLDAGEALPANVPYPVQAWSFGDALAMVFLGGEVVSEYSLRLRRELDPARLWVNAYANAVPSYIASHRMFAEGGYEVDASMNYYGLPTRLASDVEERIVGVVHELVPDGFERASGAAATQTPSR